MSLNPGTVVGGYEIERRIDRGGIGALYLAADPSRARSVVVKVYHGELKVTGAQDRFAREARAATAMRHPNLVTIFDYGDFEGQPYLVMELVQGRTLAAIIRDEPRVPLLQKLSWIEELCAAASYLHRAEIVHGDIRPSNVMVEGTGRLKLVDCGIARLDSRLSRGNSGPIGSPDYMAPEQLNRATVDGRVDIFAIGVVAYELMTRQRAFPGETFAQVHKILSEQPEPAHAIAPDIPSELSAVIARAIAKNPEDRFASVEELVSALATVRGPGGVDDEIMPTLIAVRPPSDSHQVRKPSGGHVSAPGVTPPPKAVRDDRAKAEPNRRPTRAPGDGSGKRPVAFQQALDSARAALARSDFEAARTFARAALDIEPSSQSALAIEAAAQRRIEEDLAAARALAGRAAPATDTLAPVERVGSGVGWTTRFGLHGGVTYVRRTWRRMSRNERLVAAAVAIVIAAVGLPVLTANFLRPAPPGGIVVIDAVPWARVESIIAEDGSRVALAAGATTPLSVNLPAGAYRIVLVGPPPAGESRELRVRIDGQQTLIAPLEQFSSLTPDEYFDRYLTVDGQPGSQR